MPISEKAVTNKKDLMSEFSTSSQRMVGLEGLKGVNRGIYVAEDVLVFSIK